ncbi:MAG: YebC/PmpR family DNA-binding transcriptional regulator [Planctomycetota bacterium]
MFSKLARGIITAARLGGGDPDMNLRLKYAIEKARAANMPKDNIERAIKRGTGETGDVQYEELLYEGYAPGGVAVMLEVLTDNRNRTASEIRKIFERRGGRLGESGCVDWMFERKGWFTIDRSSIAEDALVDIAVEAGADNVEMDGDIFEVTCSPENFESVREAFRGEAMRVLVADLSRLPTSKVKTETVEDARKILGLMDALEEHDDVQNVFANFDISEELLKQFEEEGN